MDPAALALLGGGGGSSGGSSSTNESVVSKLEVVTVDAESSSYPDEAELELGLGLSIGGGCSGGKGKANAWGECGRILTAKDFPCVLTQPVTGNYSNNNNHNNRKVTSTAACGVGAVSGTKRAADSVSHEGGSPTAAASQVVGWPPIRTYRINSLVNQAKASRSEENKPVLDENKSNDASKKKICNGDEINATSNEVGHLGFVKVNMDGIPIGRKVDLNAIASYETLAWTLEDMFFRSTPSVSSTGEEKQQTAKPPMLLVGSSEFKLTYEDKDGDWMLVGDVPWRMFITSVKRLRIMRISEANGLAPRSQARKGRQRSKPI